jgi:phenylpropionate dioxygenase-like ring-hydroxylating dioxygenase large terminal subunit
MVTAVGGRCEQIEVRRMTVSVSLDQRGGATPGGGIDEFLATIETDLRQGTLPVRVFGDPEIYQLELERIFAKCWIFVALEAEIPEPGDYVLRYIGRDQFIIVRDRDGVVRALFNKCRHRGSQVCRSERGTATHFTCPYHAWSYKNTGEWSGAPYRTKAYKELAAAEWGLASAPHVDSVHGLIFASLDAAAPTLDEYLGGMRWYLDAIFGLTPTGMKPIGRPQRWKVQANWKSNSEQHMADAYHVPFLHHSAEDVGMFPGIERGGAGPEGVSRHVFFDEGHGMILNQGYLPAPWHTTGYPPDVAATFELDRLSPEQRTWVEQYSATTFMIFPNLGLVRVPSSPHPQAPPSVFTYLRTWQPLGPNEYVNSNWTLGWKSASDQFNDEAYVAALSMHGPTGILESDDTVVFQGAPNAGASVFARKQGLKFNYQLGLNGMSDYELDPTWPFPGHASTTALGEAPQRAFYHRWLEEMRRP